MKFLRIFIANTTTNNASLAMDFGKTIGIDIVTWGNVGVLWQYFALAIEITPCNVV